MRAFNQWVDQETVKRKVLSGAFFWLCAFYFVYCARPEEWVPLLGYLPLAKITAGFALLSLLASAGKTPRTFKNLPREAKYLLGLICVLFLSAFLSPIWKGGAFWHTVDFAKVYIAWVLTFLLTTDWERLKRVILIQNASVSVIAAISIVKGYNLPRLEGIIGGIYSNPNDLAFALVLSIPFNLAFLLSSKTIFGKMGWAVSLTLKTTALLMTASRAGALDFICAGAVCLWYMGVKGRRIQLLVATAVIGTILVLAFGGRVKERFEGTAEGVSGDKFQSKVAQTAYASYEARVGLMEGALQTIAHYPILGIGVNNFVSQSGDWHEVHMAYLQIAAEGGIPSFVLYLLFMGCGFRNLKQMRRMKKLDPEIRLFTEALYASMVGFAVGAIFAPEAYHYFPYFAVAYTSVLVALVKEHHAQPTADRASAAGRSRLSLRPYATDGTPETVTLGN